jgi:limonene 1,2-monooxygenase
MGMPMAAGGTGARKAFEATLDAGGIIAGNADECVAQIEKLQQITGGFGTLLISVMDWASPAQVYASLERFARFVAPRLRHTADGLIASNAWASAHRDRFQSAQAAARTRAMKG